MSPGRQLAVSLTVGIFHLAGLILIALHLGYSVAPTDYTPLGVVWRYGGLVLVGTLPVWLGIRYRLLLPLLGLMLTTGYVLGMELTPPGPSFRDVSELEHLPEPTGIMVVENGLYIIRYMVNATVWSVGFLFLALVEYAVRTNWRRIPSLPSSKPNIPIPSNFRRSLEIATVAGLLHAVVMVWFAHRLGATISGITELLVYGYGAAGMWLLAAVPTYLIVRHRLLTPMSALVAFIFLDVSAEFSASVDDPHALYFGAWFLYLAIILVIASLEYGFRFMAKKTDLIG